MNASLVCNRMVVFSSKSDNFSKSKYLNLTSSLLQPEGAMISDIESSYTLYSISTMIRLAPQKNGPFVFLVTIISNWFLKRQLSNGGCTESSVTRELSSSRLQTVLALNQITINQISLTPDKLGCF